MKKLNLDFLQNKNVDEVRELYHKIFNLIKEDILLKENKIDISLNKQQFSVQLASLFVGLLFVPIQFYTNKKILSFKDILFINKDEDINKAIKRYIDETITDLKQEKINEFKQTLAKSLEELSFCMYQFNEIKGNTVNIYDLFQMMLNDPAIYDIINFSLDERLQYADMEDQVKAKTDELVKIINAYPEQNCLKDTLSSISLRQFQQVFVNISLKPDLYGKIYPRPINTSFIRGMREVEDYYTNAMGCRKSLIINSTNVRSSGYLARKLSLLVLNQKVLKTEIDCGTTEYLTTFIENKSILNRFKHRIYVDKNELKIIDIHDTSLIGKRLKLRSPIMCKSSGDNICSVCYGGILKTNELHPSLTGVLFLTNQMTQALLSSKHLLQVNVSKVILPDDLMEFFYIDKDILFVKEKSTISFDNVLENEETGELYIEEFTINSNGKDAIIRLESLELNIEPILDRINLNVNETTIVLESEQEAFKVNIENSELSTPLKKIINKIESQEKLNEVMSISLLLVELLALLEKGNIKSPSVIMECILRELIRNPDNLQERPINFNSGNYIILRLTNALIHNKSAAITLAFERLKHIIENNLFSKSSESIIDGLF